MQLEFKIDQQIITRLDTNKVVGNSKNYLYAKFSFSDEWEGVDKTAVFRKADIYSKGSGVTYSVLLEDNMCKEPHEVIADPMFLVSVFGGERITANRVEIPVLQSGYAEGETPSEPTPTVYEQLLEKAENMEKLARDVIVNEPARVEAENQRVINEENRVQAEQKRAEEYKELHDTTSALIQNTEVAVNKAISDAQTALSDAQTAIDTAETATAGVNTVIENAEKVIENTQIAIDEVNNAKNMVIDVSNRAEEAIHTTYIAIENAEKATEDAIKATESVEAVIEDAENVIEEAETVIQQTKDTLSEGVANALKGTVSGEAIGITDISPIEHNMGVKISGVEDISTVKLYKQGKNLADSTIYSGGAIKPDGITEITYKLNSVLPANIPLRAKLFFEDGTKLDTGCQLTVRQRPYYLAGELLIDVTNKAVTLTEEETTKAKYVYILVNATGGATYANKIPYGVMFTLDTPTKYEPYIEPTVYDVKADGTVEGVTSLYPNTTLYTDTQGAVIDVEYNRDINKAIQYLTDLCNKFFSEG
jgi:hypothetical protein